MIDPFNEKILEKFSGVKVIRKEKKKAFLYQIYSYFGFLEPLYKLNLGNYKKNFISKFPKELQPILEYHSRKGSYWSTKKHELNESLNSFEHLEPFNKKYPISAISILTKNGNFGEEYQESDHFWNNIFLKQFDKKSEFLNMDQEDHFSILNNPILKQKINQLK